MTYSITLGWWLVPLFISIAAVWWCQKQDYSGDYNFTALFYVPAAASIIATAWMFYFGIGWALS